MDTSEDEDSDESTQKSTSRMGSPIPPPSFGPSRLGSVSSVSSNQPPTVHSRDINEILHRIHEISGEITEMKVTKYINTKNVI